MLFIFNNNVIQPRDAIFPSFALKTIPEGGLAPPRQVLPIWYWATALRNLCEMRDLPSAGGTICSRRFQYLQRSGTVLWWGE